MTPEEEEKSLAELMDAAIPDRLRQMAFMGWARPEGEGWPLLLQLTVRGSKDPDPGPDFVHSGVVAFAAYAFRAGWEACLKELFGDQVQVTMGGQDATGNPAQPHGHGADPEPPLGKAVP